MKTLTVSELISILKRYGEDVPVVAAWDSGYSAITGRNIGLESPGRPLDGHPVATVALVLDVEDHGSACP